MRAFDLVRYRNFRTCTSPRPVQFTCLAVDPSGEARTNFFVPMTYSLFLVLLDS